MPNLIINGQPQSTYVRSARMACIESGVSHEVRRLAEGPVAEILAAMRTEDYLRKHPFARMPSLEDGDFVVFETSAICRYVSDTYGKGCLVPSDPREAVRMEQWVSAANCYIIPDTAQKLIQPFVFHDDPDLEAVERDKPILRSHYEILDRALDGRTVLAGDGVTVADLLLAPLLHVVGQLPGGLDLFQGLDNLGRWWEAVSTRESFQETKTEMPGRTAEAA